jgi:DNA (cytosine-5)-methyltransferase 1
MRYGSVCSGIEAATMGWHHMGWEPAFFSEIENFPRQVLNHHYPVVPCHGDFTTIGENDYGSIDLLVGGTPCQSFSVAGLRGGMADERGNLALEYLKLAQRKRPRWLVWENVPGVLSSNGGRDFGAFIGGLVECGYGWAYRICDAQYFGVAQRRRRVFVVGYLGDWRRAAAVLFERESLSGNPAPSREEGEKVAPTLTQGFGQRGVCTDSIANGGYAIACNEVSPAVTTGPPFSRTGNERVECEAIVPVAFPMKANACEAAAAGANVSPTLKTNPMAVAFAENQQADVYEMNVTNSLSGVGGKPGQGYQAMSEGLSVRRLTPTECERLQGFPDGFTQIPWRNKEPEKCPDGPRYKALGNSMAVPVMKWIGERIQAVEAMSDG